MTGDVGFWKEGLHPATPRCLLCTRIKGRSDEWISKLTLNVTTNSDECDLCGRDKCPRVDSSIQSFDTRQDEEMDCLRAERAALLNRVDTLAHALRGLLLSRDAAWTGGHDWQEAVDDAIRALGIAPGEDTE